MQFKTPIELIDSNIWHYVVKVPKEFSDKLIESGNKRVVCKVDNILNFQCALMPRGDNEYFINFNKAHRKVIEKSGLKEITVTLEPDNSEYGLPFPEVLKELLDLDDEGDKIFHALTKGKQRTLLHIIDKPKSIDIRIRKAITIVDYLKATKGNIDFKQMNEALKVRK